MNMQNMTSNRPYLIRAYYEWIVDNNLTPHLVVDANIPGVIVPQEHIKDGQIVLNISPTACGNLQLGSLDIEFDARFSGVPRHILIPCSAVLAIYARENGAGTMFPKEEVSEASSEGELEAIEQTDKPKTELKLTSAEDASSEVTDSDEGQVETPPKPPKKGRPNLKVIK